jgi:hypothetical protein
MNKKVEIIGGIPAKDHKKCHDELRRCFGKATKCEMENCASVNPKRFEWAKRKDRPYTSNADDYIQLCPSCHRKYDFTEEIREKLKAKKYGDIHNAAILKNEQVLEIVKLINKGIMNKEIAATYMVHPTTISDIKRGKRWGYLTGIKKEANP